jgi:LacI family transcriptional regulator
MKKLTLEEIGKMAGVSRATVSRVVNSYPHIRPEVRERVERIIAETGYQPNLLARSLASDRSNIIGLVIPSAAQAVFADPYFPILIQGITQVCNANSLTLSLFLFHSREEEQRAIRSISGTGLLDALIITADRKNASFIPMLRESHVPFVLIGRPEQRSQISYIDTDNVTGAKMATDHLIQLGYRRIATIATEQNTAGDDRYTGYVDALRFSGIAVDENLIEFADFSMESGYKAMKRLLQYEPDAVFVTSDTMALGALHAIREARLRIPDDIAMVGFDDLPPAVQAEPPLTTVRHPIKEAGAGAVEMLIDVMNNGSKPPRRKILPTKLIVRASCGAVRS